METKEKLRLFRNIFYKSFFLGVIFLIIATFLYMPCKCYLANFYQTNLGISTTTYYNLWVFFVGLIKTIVIFLFLVPALAIHWVEHSYSKENGNT